MSDAIISRQPQAGEWWTSSPQGSTAGLRVFVVGRPCGGDGTRYLVQEEDLEPHERHLNGWRHLPGCTGFYWVEPELVDAAREALEAIAESCGIDHLGLDPQDIADLIIREMHGEDCE